MKVVIVIGTRPEAIKMAPVALELLSHEEVQLTVLSTGQHEQLLENVLEFFGLTADQNLRLMKDGQSLGQFAGRAIVELEAALGRIKPDYVLVHGDTSTAFCAALASFYLKIPVVHVEAGLRTNNLYSPYPEELNRQLIGRVSEVNFAPTLEARGHLIREGVDSKKIFVVGNTVVDSAKFAYNKFVSGDALAALWGKLERLTLGISPESRFVLVTLHRRENSSRFREVLTELSRLAKEFPDVTFVYPVHPNPSIRDLARQLLSSSPNFRLTSPLDYPVFAFLLSKASLVITDSGGVQEEGVTFGRKILVIRDTTERPEGILSGYVKLVGVSATSERKLLEEARNVLNSAGAPESSLNLINNPYGDGATSERIVHHLLESYMASS